MRGAGVLLVGLLLCPLTIRAQETVNTGTIAGRVTDQQAGGVAGARVTARQTDTNLSTETVSDRDGRFRFVYLRVGPYEVKVHAQGFRDVVRTVTLGAGSAFDLPIALTVASLEAQVNVIAETVIEAARSQVAATVTSTEAGTVPMNGRNAMDLALLVPGVSPTNIPSTQLFAETSAVPGNGVSIGSQRNFSNNFIVDGLSANDDAAGLSGMPIGVDAVDQLQVVTSGGQAELGRALGGYVNVVTRSGTNLHHGTVYDFVRDRRLNAPNALTHTRLPMAQQQFGGSVGGPILRARTFYFANVERRQLDQTGVTTIAQDTVDAINARLAAVSYPGQPVRTGTYPNPVRSTTAVAKVDHQAAERDQLSLRYNSYGVTSTNSRGAGGTGAPSASAALDSSDRAVAVSNTFVVSDHTVNETRAQIVFSDLKAPPADTIGPAVTITGVASFGTLSGSPTRRQNRLYQVVDNLSRQAGPHALRAGVDFLLNDDTITFPRSIRGAYTFSSLANFLNGIYTSTGFTQTFNATVVAQTNPNVGVYAQDEWAATPSLTLNLGIRYDLQFLETIATDRNNVSPRLGFSWSPAESRRTVVRASAGLFFDRVPLRALANALLSAGNTADPAKLRQVSVTLAPAQAGAPVFPNVLTSPATSGTLPNLTTMDPHMQNAYSRQANVEIEQQIGSRSTVAVSYQYIRGLNLLIQVNQNVPTCAAAGTNNGCRPNLTYANNNQYSPLAHSTYHGVHVSFVQRPTRWGSYRISYTLSKAMDDVGETFFSSPIDPTDLSKDWARSDDDQRHRFVATGAVSCRGWQLSGTLQSYSALPLNITSGVNTIQSTAGRPIINGAFLPRNAGTGPDFFSLNLRLTRTFALGPRARLEALIEAFNLTNRTNVVSINGTFGAGAYPGNPASTFGQVTAVGDPRTVQLGIRVRF